MSWKRAIALVVVLFLFGCMEQQRYQYSTPEEVADAVRRGWVPRCIPPASTVDTEQNIDTNESWGIASFREEDEESLRRHVITWTQEKPQLRKPSTFDMWPDDMLPRNGMNSATERFYQCTMGDPFLLLVEWDHNQVFFGRPTL